MRAATMRMRLAVAVLCVAMAGADAALAQDPRATSAQQAARAFLVLTDKDDGNASWKVAGKQFQKAITDAGWVEALHDVRAPLGAAVERTLLSTQFTTRFPGAGADSDYAILIYRTSFAKRTDTQETISLEREPDAAWRVVGYFIR
jgi:Protein of unknown function (DUF4019)